MAKRMQRCTMAVIIYVLYTTPLIKHFKIIGKNLKVIYALRCHWIAIIILIINCQCFLRMFDVRISTSLQ